jgi:predicted O-methyltransferase YrrM
VKSYLSEIYRCSKTDAGRYLPTIAPETLAPTTAEFTVTRPSEWGGSMTITEISSLCYLVAARKPRKVLEIGTFKGLTTLNIAKNAPDAEVHTVDLPPDFNPEATEYDTKDKGIILRRGTYYYASLPEAQRIRQHFGDSASFDFGQVGGGVDFCLIDAAHSYDYVRNDTARVLPLISDGGLLLWHDYGRNDFLMETDDVWGVTRFLNELADVGVAILQGTSLGILVLDQEKRRKLAQHLGLAERN